MQFLYLLAGCLKDVQVRQQVRAWGPMSAIIFRPRQAIFAAVVSLLASNASLAASPRAVPDFDVVAHGVDSYFSSLPDYQAGDLITQSHIEAALEIIHDLGWEIDKPLEIVELGLADTSFLVRELSSPIGRKFMRKVARQSGTFARLDRLSTISRGQTVVRDLIRMKGGDEFVEYLAMTKSGQNLGRQLAATKQGVDLNKPTGRIYTAAGLMAELKRAYEKVGPDASNAD